MTELAVLYGIKTCDTCRKARQSFEEKGYSVKFVDVRDTPLLKAELRRFLAAFEGALINRKSTTWRGLAEAERDDAPIDLLMRHPTLMKRPVIDGKKLTLGWDAATQAVHLG